MSKESPKPQPFNAVAELLEFDLSLPSGAQLNPRSVEGEEQLTEWKQQTVKSVGALYATLGGTDTVNLVNHSRFLQTQRLAQLSSGTRITGDRSADRMLTDHTGILASMKAPVSVRLEW